METANHADDSQLNIQNDYFNNARKSRMRVTVVLTTGQRLSGLIRSFDRFTLILDTRQGDQMVFKHAIATVAPALVGERDHRGRPPRGPERGEGRPAGAPPPHRGAPSPPRDGSGPGGPPRGDRGDQKPKGGSAPQGKSFGNFMDLSSLKEGQDKAEPPRDGESAAPVAESEPGHGGSNMTAAANETAGGEKPAAKEAEEAAAGAAVKQPPGTSGDPAS